MNSWLSVIVLAVAILAIALLARKAWRAWIQLLEQTIDEDYHG